MEGGNAPMLPLAGDHGSGPDEELPGKELQNPGGFFSLSQERLQVAGQAAGLALIGAEHDQGPPCPVGHGGGDLGAVDGAQAGKGGGAPTALHGGG